MMRMRKLLRIGNRSVIGVVACLGLIGVTGCGSSFAASATSASVSVSAAVKADKAQFKQYTAVQPTVSVPTLPKRPAKGLTITITTCPLPACVATTTAAKKAALALGWKVRYLTSALTPTAYEATLNAVVQNPPKLLALTPVVPNSFISKQLAALKAKHVKIVEIAPAGDPPGGTVSAVTAGAPDWKLGGTLMGDAVVNNAGAGANAVFIWDPSLASIWTPIKDAVKNVITGAGGSVSVLDVNQAQIGEQIPSQVVSYVQAHPSVRYLVFTLSDLDAGVSEALKAAGITDVQIVSRSPQASNMAAVKDGTELAEVGEENSASGWRSIDQLARLSEGLSLGAEKDPAGWHQLFVKSNVTQTTSAPPTPGVPQAFLKAWKVSK